MTASTSRQSTVRPSRVPLLLLASGLALLAACASSGPRRSASGAWELALAAEEGPALVAPERVELRLRLDPEAERIEGRATVDVRARGEAVDRIPFRLHGLEVQRVTDESGSDLAFGRQGGRLWVLPSVPVTTELPTRLVIEYAGRPLRGLSFHAGDGTGGDDSVSRLATVDGRPGSSAWWFPNCGEPGDLFQAALELELPEGWAAAASGSVAEAEGALGFVTREPLAADAWMFVAGEFHSVERPSAAVRVLGAAAERDALERVADEAARTRLFATAWLDGIERAVEGRFVPLTLVNAPNATREGARGRGVALIDDLRLPSVSTAAARIEAGARFAAADWRDLWIAPSVADQLLLDYVAELGGATARTEALQRLVDRVEDGRPVGTGGVLAPREVSDPTMLVDAGWRSAWGARLLELARAELGAVEYGRRLRSVATREGRPPLTTAALLDGLGLGEGRTTLDPTDWLERPGRPRIVTSWEHDAEAGEVLLRVRQTQLGGSGTPRVFDFRATVEVAAGARVERHAIDVDDRVETLRLPVLERPRSVRFDPDGLVPCDLEARKALDEWFAIASDPDRPRGRVQALEALAERARGAKPSERSLYLTQIHGRLVRDRSPRVRAAAALALGSVGGEAAERWLITSATEDPESEVRSASLDGLARLANEAATDLAGLAERRFREDRTSAAAALRLRVTAEPATADGFLRARFERERDPELRAALLTALGLGGDPSLESLFVGRALDVSEPLEVRVAALDAVASLSVVAPDSVERLEGLTVDDSARVREAALRTLGALDQDAARRVLEARLDLAVDPAERRVIEASLARSR